MEINTTEIDDIPVVRLSGELNLYNAPQLKSHLHGMADEGKSRIVLNLEELEHIDSSGIGVLISAMTRLKKDGGQLKLAAVSGSVRMLLNLTKLHNLFEIHETEGEAARSF